VKQRNAFGILPNCLVVFKFRRGKITTVTIKAQGAFVFLRLTSADKFKPSRALRGMVVDSPPFTLFLDEKTARA
jgi:hypothetical protein